MNKYNLVAENSHLPASEAGSTVVAEYYKLADRVREGVSYQSEADLERAFIKQLETQAYEYLPITSEADLVLNLRKQLEKLNDFIFADSEWERFFAGELANPNQSIAEKTATIQEDHIKNLTREDGTTKNVYLIKKDKVNGEAREGALGCNIHDNSLQVINQYATPARRSLGAGGEDGQRANRYDVTVLVNGLPLVHIELKRRGVAIAEAFNQINRYSRESFWAASGLFEYVQLFIISNGTHTKYYSNTVRSEHIKEASEGAVKKVNARATVLNLRAGGQMLPIDRS